MTPKIIKTLSPDEVKLLLAKARMEEVSEEFRRPAPPPLSADVYGVVRSETPVPSTIIGKVTGPELTALLKSQGFPLPEEEEP